MAVYLDHNATTPVDARVREAMLPFFSEEFGNASSRHSLGTRARRAVERAREQVAALVNAVPAQVVFVSGGTEANNLLVQGAASAQSPGQIAVSAIEHPCVAKPARALARQGWKVRRLAVGADGILDLADLDAALAVPTGIVSVMLANNETGAIQPVASVAERARAAGAIVHTDAVQALGKIEVDFAALGVQAMSLSAHKIHGPKGAGALVLDRRISVEPILRGGGHEMGMRAGTENVPAIVGFGAAAELAAQRLREADGAIARLRGRLETGLRALGADLFGATAPRIPNTTYFAFENIDGETLVVELDRAGYCCASGAACSSASTEASATLLAMGVPEALARGAVRVSLGAQNQMQQIDGFLQALGATVARLRAMAAVTA